ncbi:hypothetical protein H4I95_05854 [Botrytis cinerea]
MSNSPKKDVPVAIHWVWVHVLPKAENKPMFLLHSRKHEESWRKLKKLAIAEWVEEKNKKSENKHISPQGFKFMSYFVREATHRG